MPADTLDTGESGDSGSVMGDHLPPSEPGEIWLPVVGYEGLYEVSNRGRVWSVPRPSYGGRLIGGHLLRPKGQRYLQVNLSANSKVRTWLVHRLVMRAFAGPPSEGHEVCHGPRGALVNHWPENLSYGTAIMNRGEDKRRDGTLGMSGGERNGSAKLTREQVVAIRTRYADGGVSQYELAVEYSVNQSRISAIVCGQSWAHVA